MSDFFKLYPDFTSRNRSTVTAVIKDVNIIEKSIRELQDLTIGNHAQLALFLLGESLSSTTWRRIFNPFSLQWSSLLYWKQDAFQSIKGRIQKLQQIRQQRVTTLGSYLITKEDLNPVLEPLSLCRDLYHPSWINKYLFPSFKFAFVGGLMLHIGIQTNWHGLWELSGDLMTAGRFLINDWIVTPMLDIWKTIRYRSSNLALVSAAALKADMESLQRMVVTFASKEYPHIPSEEVARQVSAGDVTLLLRRYEDQLQAPIKNALAGDLLMMLLIQVQKTKVDLEAAMLAMDRLLKANELNFELLAVLPLLTLLFFAGRTVNNSLLHWLKRDDFANIQVFRELMYDLERFLTAAQVSKEEQLGEIFIIVNDLIQIWNRLSPKFKGEYEERLYKDLLELSNPLLLTERKLWVVNRMYHYYPILLQGQ